MVTAWKKLLYIIVNVDLLLWLLYINGCKLINYIKVDKLLIKGRLYERRPIQKERGLFILILEGCSWDG